MTFTNGPLVASVANRNAGFALVHKLGDTNMRYLQELMDKYDNDQDGRLSLDEYLGEFSSIHLHYLRIWSILIDFTLQALRELAFQD